MILVIMSKTYSLPAGSSIVGDRHEPFDTAATAVTDHHDIFHLLIYQFFFVQI